MTKNACHSERNAAKRNVVEAVTQPTKSARPGFPSLAVLVGGPHDGERSLDFARDDKKRMGSVGFQPAVAGVLPDIRISIAPPAFSQRNPMIAPVLPTDRMSAGTGWKPALPRHVAK